MSEAEFFINKASTYKVQNIIHYFTFLIASFAFELQNIYNHNPQNPKISTLIKKAAFFHMLRISVNVRFETDPHNYFAFCGNITDASVSTNQAHRISDPHNSHFNLLTKTVLPAIAEGLRTIGSVASVKTTAKLSEPAPLDYQEIDPNQVELRVELTKRGETDDHWMVAITTTSDITKIELAQRFDTAITNALARHLGANLVQCQTRKFTALIEHLVQPS